MSSTVTSSTHTVEFEMQNEELCLTQHELQISQARFFELYDLAPFGYLTLSDTGVILMANVSAATKFGVERNALVATSLCDFICHDDQDIFSLQFKKLIETGDVRTWEMRMKCQKDGLFWAHLKAMPTHNGEYWVAFSDITDIKQAALTHQTKTEEFARSTLDGLSAHICVIDAQGCIVTTNRAWNDFAIENNAVAGTCGVGDNYLDVCIAVTGNEAEDVEEFRTGILEVLDGTVPEFTKEYTCHSLSLRRWFSCKANRFDIAGSTYTVISHTDITVRKQAENELRESNEKLRHLAQQQTTIFDASPVGIAIVVDRKIVSENRMFCQMMGYSPEEVLSKSTRLFYPSEDAFEKFGRASYPCFVEGRIYNTETDFRRKDGSIFTANITGGAIDPHDLSIGSIWIFEDITEMKSVTEQLVQSQKIESVGQLAGGLAHDFNNILSIISGYAYLMKLTMGADDKQHENLEKILTATSRAAELTHSLLAYSRKQVMNPQPQNLNTLVSNVGAFIRRLIGENIELAITMKDDPLSVDVDTVQMEQVMLNLATNARDAMPNGGVFGITTAAGSVDIDNKSNISHGSGGVCHYAVITVTDTGCGIAEHQVSCIFDPFFTTKESGKGTGLGLSMVIGIIRQHGGFVDVRSEIGVGTTFSIYLPLVASDDVGQETEASAHQLVSGTGTVLVAEDDPGVRVFMEELLTAAGYTVIPAIDGQDAVEKYSAMKDEIDLVIMDMVMPRKSGKTVCDEIRQMNSNAKVIVVSGYASDVLEQQGDLAADVMLIMKPLHPQKFMSMIAEILKK